MRRTGIKRGTKPLARRKRLQATSGLQRTGAISRPAVLAADASRPVKHRGQHRKDTIPRKVRQLVNLRDPWCQMSGSASGLEMHHRRPKQMGGDPRSHADCPCNLIRLTSERHEWVHKNRREAEAMGLLLPAETVLPGSVGVMRASEDGGVTSWPSCAGQWLSEPAERAA